jgi:catalase
MPRMDLLSKRHRWILADICLVVGTMVIEFAWTACLIGGRVASGTLLEKIPESFSLGFR